ncbi:MAG: General secretion pathway protein H [Candidatus Gallionella acididurans]|uniref:General secretion pathway protein H n=1 Tax=Candidatus Gallionella acididurans TaxID=1796491 RepID=A0A139BWX4_9PROT|nr:MAG: General secretion pathway protein H [Candidatus Gallionella acididurans]
MKYPNQYRLMSPGFTLIEMAIVLFIVALLMGGLLPTLTSQIEQRRNSDTSKQLNEIKDALIGYAVINGRLPCPASPTSNGAESPVGGGNCTNFYNGFVPAATLGLSGTTDSSGFLIDSWGNRIHYAVTLWTWNSPTPPTPPNVPYVFTTTNGMSTVGMSNFPTTGTPHLQVCSTAISATGSSCASSLVTLTSSPGVPVVIYSTGKNGAYGGTGPDEAENPNPKSADNDRVFVSHLPTGSGAPNGYFDDIVIWISPNVLINRMVAAGKLP